MTRLLSTCAVLLSVLAGCASVPPVETATISNVPATAKQMSLARQAVHVCAKLPDSKKMFQGFEALGYRERGGPYETIVETLPNGGKRVITPLVSYDTGELIVNASKTACFVGLRSMTPEQSYQLAQILVRNYDLATNAELGDGLSDHAVQAWRYKTYPNNQVLVAALKTWPWKSNGLPWPVNEPGAVVTLRVGPPQTNRN